MRAGEPGDVVDLVLRCEVLNEHWHTCKAQVQTMFKMWALMVVSPSLSEGACLIALKKQAIFDVAGLLRLADSRFSIMNTEPSGEAALDAMVVAAAFARDGLATLTTWLDDASSVQINYNERSDTLDHEPRNLEELVCGLMAEAEAGGNGGASGFDTAAINVGFAAMFGGVPTDAAFIAAVSDVKTL